MQWYISLYSIETLLQIVCFSCVLWVSSDGTGFKLAYPNISIHAVSRDTASFPHECLYMMLDIALGKLFVQLKFKILGHVYNIPKMLFESGITRTTL